MMKRTILIFIVIGLLCFGAAGALLAQESPMHPTFPLLDSQGAPVSASGQPVSTVMTCGTCHDTAFITSHTLHGDGSVLASGSMPPDQSIAVGAEMNCFLCHSTVPNNDARLAALAAGQPEWASTATLLGTGIVTQDANGYAYNPDAFDSEGALKPDYVALQDPRSSNCGACHGQVHLDNQIPLALSIGDPLQWRTFTTGQVISPQRISNSGANISGRDELGRPWDVHTERVLNCVDCHFSQNNPTYAQPNADAAPEHLVFDPRRADIGEYLQRPSHEFASGSDAMRSCDSCHEAQSSHEWLPYWEQHTSSMACESCHVPQLYAPALAARDATVVTLDGNPVDLFRGIEGGLTQAPEDTVTALVTGYQPVLLQQVDADGDEQLSPYNLVTVWYWVSGDGSQVVTREQLQAAYLENGNYAPDVVAAFDSDGSGSIETAELILDSEAKTTLIAQHLQDVGVDTPRIVGEVEPYAIHHDVIGGEWAVQDCQACHSESSRIVAALPLSSRTPGGVSPTLIDTQFVKWNGTITLDDAGTLFFAPETQTSATSLYVFGRDSIGLVDLFGVLAVLGSSAGVFVHAALRVIAGRKRAVRAPAELRHVYMYSIYERQWHWLQTFVIFGLTFTGLVIHKPEMFSLFNFAWMVDVHNVFAALLVINAALALFYHLVSGEIQQFIPRPYGFFDHMMQQTVYYVRGIFRGDPHPFEKRRDQKMNPIQQVVYLVLLNVLLPLQIITGAVMWGMQHFPQIAQALGGLPVLAPFHTLIAWLLVTFIIVHVYMTTTGHTPLANIQAMMMGYDDVEVVSAEGTSETHA